MQESFDFAADDLAFICRALTARFGPLAPFRRRTPVWQLIRSMIGARTHDTVTEPALARLMQRWPHPSGIAEADPAEVLQHIEPVTFAVDKARHLVATMRWLSHECPDYDLGFLEGWPVREALDWLERFPGVGPKVAASTLNASTLARPVFIVDCHVHRILLRFGFIGPQATAEQGRDAVTATSLSAEEMLDLFVRLKRLGQRVCRPRAPRCAVCPLAARCQKRTGLGRPPDRELRSIAALSPQGANAHFKSGGIAPRVPPFPGGPLSAVERERARSDPPNLIRLTPA